MAKGSSCGREPFFGDSLKVHGLIAGPRALPANRAIASSAGTQVLIGRGKQRAREASRAVLQDDSATDLRARGQSPDPTVWVDGKKTFTACLLKVHQCPVVRHTHFFKKDGELPAVLGGIDQAANFTVR